MGGALRDDPGGIDALLRLGRAAWAAIEDELTRRGFTLADVPGRLSWRALYAVVRHAQAGTPLAAAVFGERARWGDTEHLAALTVDLLRVLAWQQTKDGAANRNPPEPLPRPGVEDPRKTRIGDASMSLDEARAWLEARNGR